MDKLMYEFKGSLVLASGSPRRREMLARIGLAFQVIESEVDESAEIPGAPEAVAQELACRKAQAVADREGGDHWFLGVDTVVVMGEKILGKPADRAQAAEFLRRLSGHWHQVISGYCLIHPATHRLVQRAVSTRVLFKHLEADEIDAYLATDEPWDKAGAYAVQGIGAFMVERLDGSYTNVVGLPMTELVGDLRRLDVIVPRRPG